MSRQRMELLICWGAAAVFFARAASALWTQSYWVAAKYNAPAHYTGWRAVSLGSAELGLAVCFMGAWLAFSLKRRAAGIATMAAGAAVALVCFGYGLFAS